MSEQSRCGPHTQISSNEQIRLTQCPCGAYHLNLVKKGVTLQINRDEAKALLEGMTVALRVAEAEDRGRLLAAGNGSTIN
jgi:hypothetical protein